MSSHRKLPVIRPGFCHTHLRCVLACSDGEIERALAGLPAYDLNRLRRILRGPLKGVDPGQEQAG